MKEDFEFILKFSFPVIILLGLAKVTAYYSVFHFPILEYLTFSEIVIIFLNNLYIYTALFTHLGLSLFVNKDHFRGSLTLLSIAVLLVIVYSSITRPLYFNTSSSIMMVILIIMIVALLLLVLSKKSVFTFIESKSNLEKNAYLYFFIIMVLLVISGFHGRFEANEVRSKHLYTGTVIITKNDTLFSNDSLYYIGKSDNYIYTYNEKNKHVNVFPISTIEALSFSIKELH